MHANIYYIIVHPQPVRHDSSISKSSSRLPHTQSFQIKRHTLCAYRQVGYVEQRSFERQHCERDDCGRPSTQTPAGNKSKVEEDDAGRTTLGKKHTNTNRVMLLSGDALRMQSVTGMLRSPMDGPAGHWRSRLISRRARRCWPQLVVWRTPIGREGA